MRLLSAFVFLASLAAAWASDNARITYDGYKVYRVKATRELDIEAVQEKLRSAAVRFDEWNLESTDITIVVPPGHVPAFESLGLDYHTMHKDLGRSIADEARPRSYWRRSSIVSSSSSSSSEDDDDEGEFGVDPTDPAWFDSYHDWEDHLEWLEALQARHPNNSELVSTGTSYEGRDMFGIHFWGALGPGRPAVLWHGTVHAREWISAPVNEYLALRLLEGYGEGDEEAAQFVDAYDFYIFPFVNPDGFVYTRTTDRLWRKNRMPPPSSGGNGTGNGNETSTCYGRDVNRNWPYKWDANPNGASTDPCSQTYRGEAPADTPEMQGMHAYVDGLRDGAGIQLFIDWHSFSQYILAPVGWNCTHYVPTLGEHIFLAHQTADAIREVEGTPFVFGPSCAVLYASTGYSTDYAYEVGRAKYSYLFELRDTGDFGFVLPPEQIRGSVEEQWAGMRTMLSLLDEDVFADS